MRPLLLLSFLLFPFIVSAQTVSIGGTDGKPLTMSNGGLPVDLKGRIYGEDTTLNQLWVSMAGSSANVTQATTSTIVKASAGEMIGFFVNTTTSGTIRFWDDATSTCDSSAKGTTITPAAGAWYFYPVKFSTGICVLTGGTAVDITAVYR